MGTFALVVLVAAAQFTQSSTGELRLTVTDAAGAPLSSQVSLVSAVNEIAQTLETGADGAVIAKRLPFGRYRLDVSHRDFASYTALVDIESVVPVEYHVVLSPSVQAEVTVYGDETLLDVRQTSTAHRVGADTLQHRLTALPGRSLSDVVNTEPGWLLEANGVLHPRGSEYQVQYVVDGLPMTDNRSPTFAPEFDADNVHSMNILTGGYPAEYGRKLGGVVEVVTAGTAQSGLHGYLGTSAGSFGTVTGSALAQYARGPSVVGVSGSLARTDRYLDPPVEENFSNHGSGGIVAGHFERELSSDDRFGIIARHASTRFRVPNERVQEAAGQVQQRTSGETFAQLSYQHVFSSRVLGDLRGMGRRVDATLSSNESATPIRAEQDRGFREGYVKGSIAAHVGRQEWKAGLDVDFGRIREAFAYRVVDASYFEPGTPASLSFSDMRASREAAVFVQDRVALGPWTINAGLRWDRYDLLVDDNAWSPRLGIAWSWPRADLVVRASYDRAFQTPAIENLLLASSPAFDTVDEEVVRLPVRPSRGDFVEVGASKRLFSKARLDVTLFNRRMTNFADDDVLLNTGVSFPIAFDRARIRGAELKFDLPRWRALSGSLSYGYMVGFGWLPVTGGLLLGSEDLGDEGHRFAISQDQRHTLRTRVNYGFSHRASVSLAGSYGSGLPVEYEGDPRTALEQFGPRIVSRVDFERGRVRPSATLDGSAGLVLMKRADRQLRVQVDGLNLTNRLNVVNFAGLFSGTALAPPRSLAVRLHAAF